MQLPFFPKPKPPPTPKAPTTCTVPRLYDRAPAVYHHGWRRGGVGLPLLGVDSRGSSAGRSILALRPMDRHDLWQDAPATMIAVAATYSRFVGAVHSDMCKRDAGLGIGVGLLHWAFVSGSAQQRVGRWAHSLLGSRRILANSYRFVTARWQESAPRATGPRSCARSLSGRR